MYIYICQIIHVRTYIFHVQYRSMCGMKDSPAVKVVIACLNIFLTITCVPLLQESFRTQEPILSLRRVILGLDVK